MHPFRPQRIDLPFFFSIKSINPYSGPLFSLSVLAALNHRGAFMELAVHENQGHAAFGLDLQPQHAVVHIELGFPAGEIFGVLRTDVLYRQGI